MTTERSAVTEILHTAAAQGRALALRAALGVLAVYRALVSPLLVATLGPACRFEPTCSQYAHQALAEHGLGRGLYLTVRRLMRCHPLGGWGYDPVPAHPAHARRHP
jgi:putative membrane protein insertion efficiency factor